MEKWKVFYINGVEKCAYTLFGTFDGEDMMSDIDPGEKYATRFSE